MSLDQTMAGKSELERNLWLCNQQLASARSALKTSLDNYDRLKRRFDDQAASLAQARAANSRYFMEVSKLRLVELQRKAYRPQLVVIDCGTYTDATGINRNAWSVWLDGVRLYTTSVVCDWADQPERLWLTVEALERALGVKAMRGKVKPGSFAEAAGGGPRKLTPVWLPFPFGSR